MEELERTGKFDHLFTETVQESVGGSPYGAWRSVSSENAASLGLGFPFPESFPNDELTESTEALLDVEADSALQYGGGDYSDQLAEAVAERASERGIDCDADGVMLANGSTHAMDTICHTFLEPGDCMFVEAPTFMGALSVFRNYGVEIDGFELDEDGVDLDAVESELAARRADGRELPTLFYTIPTFQNPTGTTLSLDRRKRLLELAEEYDFIVLEDDAYGELRYDGESIPTLAELDDEGRVVHVGTFSKTIAPGVRTGWVIAHQEILDQVRGMASGGTNTFTQGVLGHYCEEGHLERKIVEFREAYEKRRDHMLDCLDEHMPEEATWTEPDGGFFIWAELPEGIDTEEMLSTAAEEGVVYLPGSMFFPGDRGENGIRLSFSYAPLDEMERGIEALARTTRAAMDDD